MINKYPRKNISRIPRLRNNKTEMEKLLDFYRTQYHNLMQTIAFQNKLIEQLRAGKPDTNQQIKK